MEVSLPLEALARLSSKKADELQDSLFVKDGDTVKPVDNAVDVITGLIGEKFKAVSTDQYKRGQRETAETYERQLASLGFDPQGRRLDELLEELATKAKATPVSKDAPLDELMKRADVRDHLKTATEKQVAALKEELTRAQQELESTRSEYTRAQTLATARTVLERELDALGWDDGGELRAARLDVMVKLLPLDQIKVENGAVVLTDANGEPMRDNLHNPVPFGAWVEKANVFGTKRKDAPRGTPPTGNGQQPQTLRLASEAAGLEMLAAESDPAKKAQILKALAELKK